MGCGREVSKPEVAPGGAVSATAMRHTIEDTGLALAEGERVWRKYDVTKLKPSSQEAGRLYVTGSRLIFHASVKSPGRHSELVLENKIDAINGVRTYITNSRSWGMLIVAAALVLLGLAALANNNAPIAIVLWAVAIIPTLAGLRHKGGVSIGVFSQQTSVGPISFGNAWDTGGLHFPRLGGERKDAFGLMFGIPGEHALQVASELGALILDLQTKGSLAAPYWGVKLNNGDG